MILEATAVWYGSSELLSVMSGNIRVFNSTELNKEIRALGDQKTANCELKSESTEFVHYPSTGTLFRPSSRNLNSCGVYGVDAIF